MALSLTLILAPSARAQQNAQAAVAVASINPTDLSLESDPDDTPQLARLKAALRLMSAYSQVQIICEKCNQPQIMKTFHSANGSVLPKVIAVLKEAGAMTDDWKETVDKYTNEAVEAAMAENDCAQLMGLIKKHHWTLYQGRFVNDYKLISRK
ncbi:MAG: hypothetical protein LBJ61_13095 [Deltaproteobacteria bacterium]|nr:hypothetical protein [Deltaproteobacteria bacterium]